MAHHGGQVGRHQRGDVRLDGQRAEEIITPDEGREWIRGGHVVRTGRIGGREWRSSP